MKSTTLWIVLAGLMWVGVGTAISQEPKDKSSEKKGETKPEPPDMAAMATASAPSEEHTKLAPLVGKWNMVFRMPTGEPGKWEESKGTAEYRWIMGGRYLVEEVKCDFSGATFEWMGIYGFDMTREKYTGYWVDNLTTEAETAECVPDPSGKVFNFLGEQSNPMTGQKTKFRWVIKLESAERVRVDMFEPTPDGKENKSLEIVLSRP